MADSTPRKIRSDATLKELPHELRAQVVEWNDADGWQSCVQRIFSELHIASPKDPSKPISHDTLYKAMAFWRAQAITDEAFAFRDAQTELMKQFRPGDANLAREFGEFSLLQRANQTQDKDTFMVVTMAQDSRRRLDQDEKSATFKAEVQKVKLAQKDRDFALAREKFVTESCEKIMQAARDPKVREIVDDSKLTNAEKIAAIREKYFADIDAVKVELPE